MNKREIGNKYEDRSVDILKKENYKILERNYQSRYGEIDIIAIKADEIVFVEVKYRKNSNYGFGFEAVNRKKLKKIFNLAQMYIQEKRYFNYKLRFDCMSYLNEELSWIKDMAWGDENGF